MSLPRTLFMDCLHCGERCIRVYTAGTERGGVKVLVRKYQCERCGKTQMTVEKKGGIPRDQMRTNQGVGWPKPDRTWRSLKLSRDAFA